jgi:TetR/AcrR family transcriptional repressor of nem operon
MVARPYGYVRTQVLTDAMKAFWRQGYNGTSIANLTDATGLQRGSIYAEFKSKRGLFEQTLEHYFSDLKIRRFSLLEGKRPPLERLRKFYTDIFEDQCDNQRAGCLLVNTLLELPPDDKDIIARVSAMFKELQTLIEKVLLEAKNKNQIRADLDIKSLAKHLIVFLYGLRVYSKTKTSHVEREQVIHCLIASIKA